MNWTAQLARLVAAIEHKRRSIPLERAMLAGISGIDGSGKSTLAPLVVQRLNALGRRTVLIQLDDWHHPPAVRFHPQRPAETFYEKGLRHEELFANLVLPLKEQRRVRLTATISRQPDEIRFAHTFDYEEVDIIVFEGIFIFKRQFWQHFDFRCWVECSFDVALQRALRRNQEGLPADAIVRDYHTIYFPAQRLHFDRDRPADGVDFLFQNGADAAPQDSSERLAEAAIL
jgi:uridine kinase